MKNMLEKVNCIFCGSNKYKPLFSRIDARYYLDEYVYTLNQCYKCGGYFLSPRIKEEYIFKYYPNEFYCANNTPGEVWKREFLKNKKKYDLYLKEMRPGRLLDIGCRDGSFVKLMDLFGWQTVGYEYSEDVKNRFGCQIYYKNLYQFNKNSFDVITLWAVLEHLYHPNDYIEYFQNILKPGGFLIIQVPKFNSFTGKFLLHDDVPRHVSAFTSKGLITYIEKYGFNLERINTRCPVFSGSSYGVLRYITSILKGRSQSGALRIIYGEQFRKDNIMAKLDLHISKFLDIALKKFDRWGQMTAVFNKRN